MSRFMGLGESDAKDLTETTMNPATSKLIRISIDNDEPGDTEYLVHRLSGKKPERRFPFIRDNARIAKLLDV